MNFPIKFFFINQTCKTLYFSEDYYGVNGFVLLKCFLSTLKRQVVGTTKNTHQINISQYCILLYFGIIIKQSIKVQCYKKKPEELLKTFLTRTKSYITMEQNNVCNSFC